LLVSGCERRTGQAGTGDQPPTAARYSRRHWKEQAMFLIGLIIVIAVLMIVVLPRIRRRKL
jgi:hypothetical protein